jgi:hypothetical protein
VQPKYFVGLDLGRAQDFTALAALERTEAADPNNPGEVVRHYAVRHLERLRPGTPYPEVCARVACLLAVPPLRGATLAVDHTGVGRPALDLLRKARLTARLCPVLVTAGHQATADHAGGWCVPRSELAGTLQVLLQSRRLQIVPTLPEAQTLARELGTFRPRAATASEELLGSWRERDHDDLVLAVAVAVWLDARALSRLCIFC